MQGWVGQDAVAEVGVESVVRPSGHDRRATAMDGVGEPLDWPRAARRAKGYHRRKAPGLACGVVQTDARLTAHTPSSVTILLLLHVNHPVHVWA